MSRYTTCAAALLLLVSWSHVSAQTKSNQRGKSTNSTEALQSMQKEVASAQTAVQSAEQALALAEQQFRNAGKEFHTAEEEARRNHQREPEVERARSEVNTAKTAFEDLRGPIIDKVHAAPEFAAAKEKAAAARRAIDNLGDNASSEDRERVLSNVQTDLHGPEQMEQAAIQAEPAARAASERLKSAEKSLAEAAAKRKNAIDNDGGVKSAKSRLDGAKGDRDRARLSLAQARQQLSNASEQYLTAVAIQQQIQAARAANSTRYRRRGGGRGFY